MNTNTIKLTLAGLLLSIVGTASASKQPMFDPASWQTQLGTRLWFSTGSDGAPQPLLNSSSPPASTLLASRLTFVHLDAYSGEIFARADHVNGFFVKGNLGAGGILSGELFDEDFPAGPVYSRTKSDSDGYLSYFTADIGRDYIKTQSGNVGAYIGYNYYRQHITTTGCVQVAGSTVCRGDVVPSNYPGITEDDHFYSMRIGMTTQFLLTDRLSFTADSAWVPFVTFDGEDDHNARQLIGPEHGSNGDGVMMEALFNYHLTDYWDIGAGARYWAWNMHEGYVTFDFLNVPGPGEDEPARFTTERYGVFLQGNYHWENKSDMQSYRRQPVNWSGLELGGYLGGGNSHSHWSDPFRSTTEGSYTNVAGFGDEIHATGPLAGVEIDYNWQRNALVYGLSADGNITDIRGENTCFSGLGGLNCEHVVNTIGTLAGRFGGAFDRSLMYVKGGVAWTVTTYDLDGNTSAVQRGADSTTVRKLGWTLGAGIENAITDKWIASAEYDFIEVPSASVQFSAVNTVNTASIRVRQPMNLFKLGFKYKL